MQVELKANGKTVQVEMTEEQLKELGVIKPRTGYERMEKDSTYFSMLRQAIQVVRQKQNIQWIRIFTITVTIIVTVRLPRIMLVQTGCSVN